MYRIKWRNKATSAEGYGALFESKREAQAFANQLNSQYQSGDNFYLAEEYKQGKAHFIRSKFQRQETVSC